MSKHVSLFIKTLVIVSVVFTAANASSNACRQFYKPKPISLEQLMMEPDKAWALTLKGIKDIQGLFEGSEYLLHPLFTAIISKEFGWLNGDPGGAKTLISETVFKSELRSISDTQKKTFMLQFHKLLNEGVITGFPNLKKMLDNGEYERNIENSLIADRFIFLIADEVEKAHPALQTTLLSVLNERKAFLGSEIVNTILASGVFTSNKTIGELVDAAGEDRAAIEALVDRMSIKVHVINQTIDTMQSMRMRRKIEWAKNNPIETQSAALHLGSLLPKIQIPRQMLEEAAALIEKVDGLYNSILKQSQNPDEANVVKSFFPPNQFSIRSDVKLLSTWKAAFLSKQLLEGVPFSKIRYKMRPEDLKDLAIGTLLNGPGQIREKAVLVSLNLIDPEVGSVVHKMNDVAYEPRAGKLNFKAIDGTPLFVMVDPQTKQILTSNDYMDASGTEVSAAVHLKQEEVTRVLTEAMKTVDESIIEIEDDGTLQRYLSKRGIPKRTRNELNFINESRVLFINSANASIAKIKNQTMDFNLRDDNAVKERLAIEQQSKEVQIKFNALAKKGKSANPIEVYQLAAESVRQSFTELASDYKELNHSIKAHFVSILARTHLLSYGPPGGAKTSLARTILSAVLKTVNESVIADFNIQVMKKYGEVLQDMKRKGENYKEFEMFFRQFHKMVPEGEIIGFPKLNEQLKSGKLVYDRTNSLSHERFLFAILDEVEKSNPALLQTLLSVLNERKVFAGHEVVKVSLVTAILTSNKVPFEFLQAFADDLPAGLALLDRTINKNFVPNKFAKRSTLVKMFEEIQSGTFNPRLTSPLMLVELQPLLDKVHLPERLEAFITSTYKEFVAERLELEESSKDDYDRDRASNPNYYVPATKPSNRSENAVLDQLKASWLIDKILDGSFDVKLMEKLANGETIENIKFEIEWKDAHLLAQGLLYWGPYEIVPKYNANAALYFELNDSALQALINSSGTTPRLAYQLTMIQDEAKQFVQMMNGNINETITKHRDLIGKFPNLFPGLFKK